MQRTPALTLTNAAACSLADVPEQAAEPFRDDVISRVARGAQIGALFGSPLANDSDHVRLYAVLLEPATATLRLLSTVVGDRYPALTPDCPAAHLFECELAEQWGVVPEGHPRLLPVRFQRSGRAGRDAWRRAADAPIAPGVTDFFRVEGDEIHEVAVGPIHAGVIEPGHFRFQCLGEQVLYLQIALGYQHRGVERALVGGPNPRTLHYVETLAGDTTVGHALAYCQAYEALRGIEPPPRAQVLRGIALELERLANHTGDLGALAQDVGYLPTAAFCGRLRGDFLNATAAICGNRFGRSLVRPGGVRWDIEHERAATLKRQVAAALADVQASAQLLWDSVSVQARFEDTGRVDAEAARQLGLVGPPARACGIPFDARTDFPSGIYRLHHIPVATWNTGDVFARAYVRALEIQRSGQFVQSALEHLPRGALCAEPAPSGSTSPAASSLPANSLPADSLAVSLVEGWRGAICHVVLTDSAGRIARYKVVDPSFHNWSGLALALRGQEISDFPLSNKSFNLSYCGHDL